MKRSFGAALLLVVGWQYRPLADDAWREAFADADPTELRSLASDYGTSRQRELWAQYRAALREGDPLAIGLASTVCAALRPAVHPTEELVEAVVVLLEKNKTLRPLFEDCPGAKVLE